MVNPNLFDIYAVLTLSLDFLAIRALSLYCCSISYSMSNREVASELCAPLPVISSNPPLHWCLLPQEQGRLCWPSPVPSAPTTYSERQRRGRRAWILSGLDGIHAPSRSVWSSDMDSLLCLYYWWEKRMFDMNWQWVLWLLSHGPSPFPRGI